MDNCYSHSFSGFNYVSWKIYFNDIDLTLSDLHGLESYLTVQSVFKDHSDVKVFQVYSNLYEYACQAIMEDYRR